MQSTPALNQAPNNKYDIYHSITERSFLFRTFSSPLANPRTPSHDAASSSRLRRVEMRPPFFPWTINDLKNVMISPLNCYEPRLLLFGPKDFDLG